MKSMQQNIKNVSIRRELLPPTFSNVKRQIAKLQLGIIAVCAIFCCGQSLRSFAIGSGDADTAIAAFNTAFLYTSGSTAYYKAALNNSSADGFWSQALDIQGEEDAYERTGSSAQQTVINNLLATFLVNNPPSWSWDGWNDDIGWVSMALARGYQMTGTANFLTQAQYGYNYAYGRGWDTVYNGGGIWEQQPSYTPAGESICKAALSNDSLGKTACMLYQSTGNSTYLTQAQQIYTWVRSHLFNPSTGQVYASISTNGVVDTGTAVYNQGTFVDYANLLYKITGQVSYYNDALKAVEFTRNNLTVNGILSNDAGYLNTWADEFARGLGHFVKYNNLWSTYYPWMLANANAAWGCRRTDLNIAWNAWAEQTPTDNTLIANKFVSAVAMLQFTPATQPRFVNCTNKLNGTIIGTSGSWGNQGNTIAKVFDGNQNTFFDGPDANGDWVGLDFGAGVSNVIGQINYWPRVGYANRMLGGVFQGDSDPTFPHPVTIFTIATEPPETNVVTSQTIGTAAFRCVRYLGPANANCDVAEIQFFAPNPIAGSHFVANLYSSLVLEDPGFATGNGTNMVQWGYNGGSNQKWTFSKNSDGSYTMLNGYSGLALDDPNNSTTNGTPMVQWASNGGSNQHWSVNRNNNDGSYTILNVYSGKALDDPGFSTASGTIIDQWTSDGGLNQRWLLQ